MAVLSINEMTTFRWSFDEDVARYRDAGIGAIGVWRRKLADYGEERGVELIARQGLIVSNLLWAGGFTGSDGHTYQESVLDASEALHLAAALGTRHLVVYSGPRNGHTRPHARRLFVSALAELLPLAQELQVTLAIEPMHAGCAQEWTFLTGLEDALTLVDELNSPYVKLVLDTYHLGHDSRLIAQIPAIVDRIGIVHLADASAPPDREQNRQPLGAGKLPLPCLVQALAAAGYAGFYDVELIGEQIERCDYEQLLCRSQSEFAKFLAPVG